MTAFWEIASRGTERDVIQRIGYLSRREVEGLRAAGYVVTKHTLSTSLYDWLRTDARAALSE